MPATEGPPSGSGPASDVTLPVTATGGPAEADDDLFSLGNLIRLDEGQALRRRTDASNLRRLPWLLWLFALVAAIEVAVSLAEGGWGTAGLAAGNLVLCVLLALASRRNGTRQTLGRALSPIRRLLATRATTVAGLFLVSQLALATGWVRLLYGAEGESGWFGIFPWLVLGFRFRPSQALAVHASLVAVSVVEVLVSGLDPGILIAAVIVNGLAFAVGSLATRRFRKDFLQHWRPAAARGREQARMQEELETARAVQLSMLPRAAPEVPGLEIAAAMVPATEVGGDYYDFFVRPDDGLVVVVGDVAGHGLASGLVLSGVRSGLLLLMEGGEALPAALERLNRMVRRTSHHRMRVTMLLVEILPDRRELRLASAGHPPLLLREAATGGVVEVDLPALPLGSRLGAAAHEEGRRVAKGDVLLLYTDGLFETPSPEGEPFGLRRVRDTLAAHDPAAGSEALRDGLLSALREMRGGVPPEDDVTVVVVTVR